MSKKCQKNVANNYGFKAEKGYLFPKSSRRVNWVLVTGYNISSIKSTLQDPVAKFLIETFDH